MSNVKSYSLEELAKHHDTTLSNVSRYVSERDYSELKRRNAELAAQVAYWKDIAEDCAVADTKVRACEILEMAIQLNETPAQCLAEHDREVSARAGKAGFIACADDYGLEYALASREGIARNADEYANKIKSGEVEI